MHRIKLADSVGFAVVVQIREILQADKAPGSGTAVKEVNGSADEDGNFVVGPDESVTDSAMGDGRITRLNGAVVSGKDTGGAFSNMDGILFIKSLSIVNHCFQYLHAQHCRH